MAFYNLTPKYHPYFVKAVEDAEFGDTYTAILPKEGEIRLVANRNRECGYYYTGIDHCRTKILKDAAEKGEEGAKHGFLPCKQLVDAHYRCLTDDLYGQGIENAPSVAEAGRTDFMNCAFKHLEPMPFCRRYFDEVLRSIYRMPKTKLTDYN